MKKESRIMAKKWLTCILILAAVFAFASGVSAGYRNKWVNRNGRYYYYNSKGKMLTGIRKVKGKFYYFDTQGRQRTGWINHNGRYYFFRISKGPGGSLVTQKKINGIRVNKLGRAVYDSRGAAKLRVMVKANDIVFSQTNSNQKMAAKRRIMFEFIQNYYTVSAMPEYGDYYDWDIMYADFMLSRGYGDCYAFAAVYGYFLNAIGYWDTLVVGSGGHAWTECKGYYFDSNWATVIGSDMCYCVPGYLSGVNGRPDWANNRVSIKHLNTL